MKIFTALWISLLVIVLTGCATSKEIVFENTMPTMKMIHDKKFGNTQALDKSALGAHSTPTSDCRRGDFIGAARKIYQSLNTPFPFLHNPVLMTYVYPHLTAGGTPIPGYVTYFKLYDTHPLALPGELTQQASEANQ